MSLETLKINLRSHLMTFYGKSASKSLTLNAPITTKVVCFSRLLKCLRSLNGKQCGPRSDCSYRAVCSGSTLFASILNSSVMLGNYLQQTTSAALRVNSGVILKSFTHAIWTLHYFLYHIFHIYSYIYIHHNHINNIISINKINITSINTISKQE